jgi:hypothetical protein
LPNDPAVRPDKCSKDENTEEDADVDEEEGIAPTVGFPPPFIT